MKLTHTLVARCLHGPRVPNEQSVQRAFSVNVDVDVVVVTEVAVVVEDTEVVVDVGFPRS